MQFTGRNLQTLRGALNRAIEAVNDEIGRHFPLEYPEEIEDLEAERAAYEHILLRVLNQLTTAQYTVHGPYANDL